MWKYLNKGISTPIAMSVILIFAIIVSGAIYWQYQSMPEENAPVLTEECEQDFDCKDIDYEMSCIVDKITRKCINNVCRIECEMSKEDFLGTIDESDNLKTYTNEEYGYEIKYPSDLLEEIKEEIDTNLDIEEIEFTWYDSKIKGVGFLKELTEEERDKIKNILSNRGFPLVGGGDGTLIGSLYFQKDQTVCVLVTRDRDTDDFACGELPNDYEEPKG